MSVDDQRRQTAGERRALIIETLSRELDPKNQASAASKLRTLIAEETPRQMIVSGDIDGLVSATMLKRSVPHWDAVALIVKSGKVLLHPDVAESFDLSTAFGVDVFSAYIPNVSNHVALWGGKRPSSSREALAAANAYDAALIERSQTMLLGTPSLWAQIEGSYAGDAQRPKSAAYRYPLGTAQILLAMLEVIDLSPKLFDRDYLPWLVANCDGGLQTIRDYPHNVPVWWSCMAAAVGPASLSEQVFQTASTQRPNQFVDIVNRLRAEGHLVEGSPATHLDDRWNLRTQTPASVASVTKWITSLSGWPDPFRGGADAFGDWVEVPLSRSGQLLTSGLPAGSSMPERVELFKGHLREALSAVHTNFAYFDQAQSLNWVAPWPGAIVPTLPEFAPALQPELTLDAEVAAAVDNGPTQIVL